jgi:hypothetical protein
MLRPFSNAGPSFSHLQPHRRPWLAALHSRLALNLCTGSESQRQCQPIASGHLPSASNHGGRTRGCNERAHAPPASYPTVSLL